MAIAQTGLLILLIIVTGFYAGIHFSSLMNPSIFGIINFSSLMNPSIFGIINPAGDLMLSVQWAKSWQITDGFMGARMRVFGPLILVTYLLTILFFGWQWRKPIFWLLLVA